MAGGKQSKLRFTVLLFSTMSGKKLPFKPVFIGRSENPHCLTHKNKEKLDCQYYWNSTAWMKSKSIFLPVMNKLDRVLSRQKPPQPFLLYVDKACESFRFLFFDTS